MNAVTNLIDSPPVGRKRRLLVGLGVLASVAFAALAVGLPWARRGTVRIVDGQVVLPATAKLEGVADLPIYPNASPDLTARALPYGTVQTAIYLTGDTPDQVKTFYRQHLSLPEATMRTLPSAWVTDLVTESGDRITIQAERLAEGEGTRLSLIYVGSP